MHYLVTRPAIGTDEFIDTAVGHGSNIILLPHPTAKKLDEFAAFYFS
jgi:hypothetical protein